MEEVRNMSEAEIRKNPCGDDKEIDEYLNGTICEVAPAEEDLNDIDAPAGDEFEVDEKAEPDAIEDEYVGKS
jgi:hypothetical protein